MRRGRPLRTTIRYYGQYIARRDRRYFRSGERGGGAVKAALRNHSHDVRDELEQPMTSLKVESERGDPDARSTARR